MVEVEVTCIVNQVKISDLGVVLRRGEVVFLSLDIADKSKDLNRLVQSRGVARRFFVRSDAEVPSSTPPKIRTRPQQLKNYPPPPPIPSVVDVVSASQTASKPKRKRK